MEENKEFDAGQFKSTRRAVAIPKSIASRLVMVEIEGISALCEEIAIDDRKNARVFYLKTANTFVPMIAKDAALAVDFAKHDPAFVSVVEAFEDGRQNAIWIADSPTSKAVN